MRQLIWTFPLPVTVFSLSSQVNSSLFFKKKKSQCYLVWSYTRAAFSKCTVHFKAETQKYHDYAGKTANYNFTIYDVNASDKPDFDKLTDVINITIPQYVFRISYCFSAKWGTE